MNRTGFVAAAAAALASVRSVPGACAASGDAVSESTLFAGAPNARPGQWVRYVMGSGVAYLKQIGFGTEKGVDGARNFIETQVGLPGGSCNPNTLKKAYLTHERLGGLLEPYAVAIYVVKSGTFFTTWDGGGASRGGTRSKLLLLDAAYLYGAARGTVQSVRAETVRVGGRRFTATRWSARFRARAPADDVPAVEDVTVWLSRDVPLGVLKMRIELFGLEPFALELDGFGDRFTSSVGMSLEAVKELATSG